MKERVSALLGRVLAQLRQRPVRPPMSVQRSIHIGQKASATMIEVNGELLLLGVTNSSVTLIERWRKDPGIAVRGNVQ
jgi:flagellar biogenesis protein FliO